MGDYSYCVCNIYFYIAIAISLSWYSFVSKSLQSTTWTLPNTARAAPLLILQRLEGHQFQAQSRASCQWMGSRISSATVQTRSQFATARVGVAWAQMIWDFWRSTLRQWHVDTYFRSVQIHGPTLLFPRNMDGPITVHLPVSGSVKLEMLKLSLSGPSSSKSFSNGLGSMAVWSGDLIQHTINLSIKLQTGVCNWQPAQTVKLPSEFNAIV